MELLLIRHALPVRREVTDGPADPPLAPEGVEQARRLADYLRTERIDALYTSPLRRARETAAPIAEVHGLEPVVVDGVAEFDRLSPDYVPVEELKAANDPRWLAMLEGQWDSDEEQHLFHERVHESIEELIGRHRGQRIAVTCHGGVINSYLSMILRLDEWSNGFFYPNYTSIHRVAAASSGERSIVTVNETSHLRGSGLPMGLFQRG